MADAGRSAIEQILSEHEDLRGRLDEIESLLAESESGDPAAAGRLRERSLALYEHLRRHIDREEQLLLPLLRARAEGGSRDAEALEREHEEQRELLRFLAERLVQPRRPTELMVREVRSFLACLREDMAREDAAVRAVAAR